ncbi:ATP-grasp domain-containing protein [Niallia taxi]|uniref:ATP-grasp domain-containing protein n=1 Tax=Niallia taxi TaxID=2499688 RepID=UPI00203BAEDA|nr:ATP-grasp domain-containing protein [Niallia taxi]MCM3216672.1 ATP-grasp domain-containing protein [Niallia taxi]
MKTMVFLVDKRINSKISFLKHLEEYNFKKILVIENGYEEVGGVPKGYFDEMHVVSDITSHKELENLFFELIKENKIDTIVATTENIIEVAGQLRTKFGITGMQRNQAEAVRNKWIMKEMVRQHGINSPVTKIAAASRDFKTFANEIGYPLIIKPIAGWATIKTYKIENNQQLELFLEEWNENPQPMLVEQFINGKEFHIDSIVSDGKTTFSSVSEYLYNCLDVVENGKPLGSVAYPKSAEEDIIEKLKVMNDRVIRALGITNSVCHAEMFVLPNGEIYFGEIAARIGGIAVIPPIVLNTHGVDLFAAAIGVELGSYKVDLSHQTDNFTGMISLPSAVGKVVEITTPEELSKIEGIVQINIPVKKGQILAGGKDTMSRSGFVIVEGSSFKEVKERLLEVYNNFDIKVEGQGIKVSN